MIRAVVFDAVGTLIVPEPAVADVYAEIGQRHGSQRTADEVRERFRAAFAREEALDRAADWRTDEARELRRWRDIVAAVLDDARESCFAELYEHFARAESWRCDPETAAVLGELRRRGLKTALASNFDRRLHDIVKGLRFASGGVHPHRKGASVSRVFRRDEPAGSLTFDAVFVSSELLVRKPARRFFDAAIDGLGVSAAEILFVGDDLTNDYQGARDAGMHAALFDRHDRYPQIPRIRRLGDTLGWIMAFARKEQADERFRGE